MATPIMYGWVDRELYAAEGKVTVVGPYATQSAALAAGKKYGATEVVEIRSRDFADLDDLEDSVETV